jgi:hypothetical protein
VGLSFLQRRQHVPKLADLWGAPGWISVPEKITCFPAEPWLNVTHFRHTRHGLNLSYEAGEESVLSVPHGRLAASYRSLAVIIAQLVNAVVWPLRTGSSAELRIATFDWAGLRRAKVRDWVCMRLTELPFDFGDHEGVDYLRLWLEEAMDVPDDENGDGDVEGAHEGEAGACGMDRLAAATRAADSNVVEGVIRCADAVAEENPFEDLDATLGTALASHEALDEEVDLDMDLGEDGGGDAGGGDAGGVASSDSSGGPSSSSSSSSSSSDESSVDPSAGPSTGPTSRGPNRCPKRPATVWKEANCKLCGGVAGQFKKRIIDGQTVYFYRVLDRTTGIYPVGGDYFHSTRANQYGNAKKCRKVVWRWIKRNKSCC